MASLGERARDGFRTSRANIRLLAFRSSITLCTEHDVSMPIPMAMAASSQSSTGSSPRSSSTGRVSPRTVSESWKLAARRAAGEKMGLSMSLGTMRKRRRISGNWRVSTPSTRIE
jgi:hypothetical protein